MADLRSVEPGATDVALDRLFDLIKILHPLAEKADARPICWITAGDDAGVDYCPDCARWKAKHLRRHHREYRDAVRDGGWDPKRESDTSSFCEGCGHLLGYSLTRYGLAEELEHYGDGSDWAEPVTPVDAYAVSAVLYAAQACQDPELLNAAVAIGEQAVACLSDAPSTEARA